MLNQGQRLRVVHNDEVVLEKIAHTVLVNHFFENFLFDGGEINPAALERVVHFLRDRGKIGCALNDAPLGAQPEAVHEQRERRNRLGYATAVVSGIEIRNAQAFQFGGLLANTMNGLCSDQWLIIFDLCDAIMGHLLNDSFVSADTLAKGASGDYF